MSTIVRIRRETRYWAALVFGQDVELGSLFTIWLFLLVVLFVAVSLITYERSCADSCTILSRRQSSSPGSKKEISSPSVNGEVRVPVVPCLLFVLLIQERMNKEKPTGSTSIVMATWCCINLLSCPMNVVAGNTEENSLSWMTEVASTHEHFEMRSNVLGSFFS